jgi:hypothetical protein
VTTQTYTLADTDTLMSQIGAVDHYIRVVLAGLC